MVIVGRAIDSTNKRSKRLKRFSPLVSDNQPDLDDGIIFLANLVLLAVLLKVEKLTS